MERESALSGNILLALILLVVIIFIAVILVFFVFPPAPDVIPTFRANIERSGNVVYLYHDGGDPLQKGKTAFRINNQEIPANTVTFLHGQDWPWTTGETIRITSPYASQELVEIVYVGGESPVILFSSRPEEPAAPTATTTPEKTGSPVVTMTTVPTITATTSVTPPEGTGTPPTAQPPFVSFSADPSSGEVPLTVSFTDLSSGTPTSWFWSFGDGGTATVQNPIHEYQVAGVYTISLTVQNQYGASTKTEVGRISAGMIPVAAFTGNPTEGAAPLMVQFTDLSTGSPSSWAWNFGDGTGSADKNQVHMYLQPGDYSVSLMVTNSYGSNTRIQSGYIRVSSPETTEIYLSGSRAGYLLPDGYLQFVVTGPGGMIKIAGTGYNFATGDLVQLFPGDVLSGEIDLDGNGLTRFSFSDVRMYVNGELKRSGIVSDINIPQISGIKSTFTIVIPAGDTNAVLFAGGKKVYNPGSLEVSISGLSPDASGSMYLSKKTQDLTYRGGAAGYTVG
ncbi:MAG: PKD domain-containing protein [Methanoregulaceae archaeon]|nr:PKD domain-containing protein [Methanoregulaceae archaeon]